MSKRREAFSSYEYVDELIDDIDALIAEIACSGRFRRPDLEGMSTGQLEAQYRVTLAAYEHHMATAGQPDNARWRRNYRQPAAGFNAATRSPFSGQDIGERSG